LEIAFHERACPILCTVQLKSLAGAVAAAHGLLEETPLNLVRPFLSVTNASNAANLVEELAVAQQAGRSTLMLLAISIFYAVGTSQTKSCLLICRQSCRGCDQLPYNLSETHRKPRMSRVFAFVNYTMQRISILGHRNFWIQMCSKYNFFSQRFVRRIAVELGCIMLLRHGYNGFLLG
jgi:hypothetical protein